MNHANNQREDQLTCCGDPGRHKSTDQRTLGVGQDRKDEVDRSVLIDMGFDTFQIICIYAIGRRNDRRGYGNEQPIRQHAHFQMGLGRVPERCAGWGLWDGQGGAR